MDSLDFSNSETPVTIYALDLQKMNKFVKKGYDLFHKHMDKDAPPTLHHFGIAVFKKFYHFNTKGLNQSYEIKTKRVDHLPGGKTTNKTREEFEDWLLQPEILTRFTARNYHPVTNNCIDFVKSACKFLGVELDGGLLMEQIDNWLKTSPALRYIFKSKEVRKRLCLVDVDGKKRALVGPTVDFDRLTVYDEEDTPKGRRTAVDGGGSSDFNDQEVDIILQLLDSRMVRELFGIDSENLLTEGGDSDEAIWEPI